MPFTRPLAAEQAAAPLDAAVAKFFRRVVPLLILMLICNQLDRANIGYATKYLQADVGIGAAAYGLGAGIFFVAYPIFELPSNLTVLRPEPGDLQLKLQPSHPLGGGDPVVLRRQH